MPASFEDQLAVVAELLREVRRMEEGEKRHSARSSTGGYERELRLAGLAQRVAQAYTIIEGVLAYVARRLVRATRVFDTEAKAFAAGLSPARRSGRKQSQR